MSELEDWINAYNPEADDVLHFFTGGGMPKLRLRDIKALVERAKKAEAALEDVGHWDEGENARCWCAIPSLIPYRGHEDGCEAARAVLAAKEEM